MCLVFYFNWFLFVMDYSIFKVSSLSWNQFDPNSSIIVPQKRRWRLFRFLCHFIRQLHPVLRKNGHNSSFYLEYAENLAHTKSWT